MARGNNGLWILLALVALTVGVGVKVVPRKRGAKASAGAVKWSDADMQAFIDEVRPLGVPLADSLLVYTAESGLDPTASSGIAWGLPQLSQIAAKQVGWTRPLREFGTLTVAQQAPWIAKLQASQIRMIGYKPKDALELYVANFSPKAAAARSEVIYRQGTASYAKNANLDRDHKGYIAAADLKVALDRARSTTTYQDAVKQMERLTHAS